MASVLCAKLVCFSGCWGMACILLCICRKLPPCVYTTALFFGQGRSAASFYFVCTVFSSASSLVHQDGSSTAHWSSPRFFSFLVFPALSQGSLQLSPDTLIAFFLFEPHRRNKNSLSSAWCAKCKGLEMAVLLHQCLRNRYILEVLLET